MLHRLMTLGALLGGTLLAAPVQAGGGPFGQAPVGLDWGASYTQDYWQNVSGGQRTGEGAPGQLSVEATADGRLWGGSKEDKVHLEVLGLTGSSISDRVGDLQGLDNIEARDTVTLFSAWYQHHFEASGLKLRLGIQDYNALFNSLDAAGLYLNSSFGIDPTIAQGPVPIFPFTSLGAMLRWDSASGAYVMGGIYDGSPAGAQEHRPWPHANFYSGNGVLTAVEAGFTGNGPHAYKIAFGGWLNTRHFQDETGRAHSRNHGEYLIAQQRLFGSGAQRPRVDAFVQLGHADTEDNELSDYIGAGVNFTGLLPSRPDDVLGLGMARAQTSNVFRRALPGARSAETALELTYYVPVNPHLSIQPDIQYIFNPGADPSANHALVLGARAVLSL